MRNVLNIDYLINSKKNTASILTDGGQQNGNEYVSGTVYTGYVSINGHGIYRQEVPPESIYRNGQIFKTADGHGYKDITNRVDFENLLKESALVPAKQFPFDIPMDYEGGNKLSLFTIEGSNKEVEVHAYQTQYVKPLVKCKRVALGSVLSFGRRALYALDVNRTVLAVVMPWLLRADSPLQSFLVEAATVWSIAGDESLVGFEDNLQAAFQSSKHYYDEKNKVRIETDKQSCEQREFEREIENGIRIDNLIKNMSIPGSEISGIELIDIARSLKLKIHPRTVGSIKRRIQKIFIQESGFGISFYRTRSGARIGDGVKSAIGQIIVEAKNRI